MECEWRCGQKRLIGRRRVRCWTGFRMSLSKRFTRGFVLQFSVGLRLDLLPLIGLIFALMIAAWICIRVCVRGVTGRRGLRPLPVVAGWYDKLLVGTLARVSCSGDYKWSFPQEHNLVVKAAAKSGCSPNLLRAWVSEASWNLRKKTSGHQVRPRCRAHKFSRTRGPLHFRRPLVRHVQRLL